MSVDIVTVTLEVMEPITTLPLRRVMIPCCDSVDWQESVEKGHHSQVPSVVTGRGLEGQHTDRRLTAVVPWL